MACQHLAIEHGQAIVALVDHELYGSALTLQRPLFETLVRGLWLRYAATDDEVDRAGQDCFPGFKDMTDRVPEFQPLSDLRNKWWRRLCSYTHSGYRQIGARLSVTGLSSDYEDAEMLAALQWADMVQLLSGMEFALAAGDKCLAEEFLKRMPKAGR